MILDGKALSRRLQDGMAVESATFFDEHGYRPCLATVLVGDDPASAVYVRSKGRACERLGFDSKQHTLPASTEQRELIALVEQLNGDDSVHGILVQMPLPVGLNSQEVLEAIDPQKDVDGFHPDNVGLLALKRPRFVSCTPRGIMALLAESGVDPSGRRVTVVGRSAIVGLPVALLLLHANATLRVVHSRTSLEDLQAAVEEAEILVVAVGRPGFIRGEWVREGAVVIDVGINRLPAEREGERGKLVGDVEFAAAAERGAAITPVPGCGGPMTISMLMRNTLDAACLQSKGDRPVDQRDGESHGRK